MTTRRLATTSRNQARPGLFTAFLEQYKVCAGMGPAMMKLGNNDDDGRQLGLGRGAGCGPRFSNSRTLNVDPHER